MKTKQKKDFVHISEFVKPIHDAIIKKTPEEILTKLETDHANEEKYELAILYRDELKRRSDDGEKENQ